MESSRILKCLISTGVYLYDRLVSVATMAIGKKSGRGCVVLYYHSVPAKERQLFAGQLDLIARQGKIVDATQIRDPLGDQACFAITFDDAFENFLTEALPELAARNMPSTMFVISGALGKAFGPASSPERVMTVEQLRSLPNSLVSIGSHTVTHPFLPDLASPAALEELIESKRNLENLLGKEVTTFSFPFGGFSASLIELARQAGYLRIFTTLPEFSFRELGTPFVVGRVRVDPTDWNWEFRLKLAGAYRWLPTAFVYKRRLLGDKKNQPSSESGSPVRSMIHELSSQ